MQKYTAIKNISRVIAQYYVTSAIKMILRTSGKSYIYVLVCNLFINRVTYSLNQR